MDVADHGAGTSRAGRHGFLVTPDCHQIPYRFWQAEKAVANLLVAHGMSEHAGRYADFATWLTNRRINTWAIEHRGHGAHCPPDKRGHFADHDGWEKVVADLNRLKRAIRTQSPGVPLIALGHSMGSYVALSAVMAEAEGYAGLLLTGSGLNPRLLLWAGLLVSRLERWRLGPRARSRLMSALSFGSFNRRFRPNRTPFDWLSRDEAQVERYLKDPLCGFHCTTQFWCDLLRGQLRLYRLGRGETIPSSLPVRLMSGTDDPVGRFGKGVEKLRRLLETAGVQRVELQLIEGARHEVLNERDREAIWRDIADWVHRVAGR
ncbi:MAG: alpha/beta hydrolase [Gammaproteobacteria bacterium]